MGPTPPTPYDVASPHAQQPRPLASSNMFVEVGDAFPSRAVGRSPTAAAACGVRWAMEVALACSPLDYDGPVAIRTTADLADLLRRWGSAFVLPPSTALCSRTDRTQGFPA